MRKGFFKKITISLMSIAAMACLSLGIVIASANTVTIADEDEFRSVDGASVLLKTSENGGKDLNGLRFMFKMSKDKYAELTDTDAEGNPVQFKQGVTTGVMVVPTANTGKTGTTVETEHVVSCSATATQVLKFNKWKFNESEGCYYSCAYLYNFPKSSYDKEFSTCAYIETSEGREYTYVSTRSMSYVASKAIASNKYPNYTETLENYMPQASETLYSLDDKTIDFAKLGISIDRETTELTLDGEEIDYTLNGKIATIKAATDAAPETENALNLKDPRLATGEVKTLIVTTASAAYRLPLKICTDVIYTAKDFDDMQKFKQDITEANISVPVATQLRLKYGEDFKSKRMVGYYALGADIDFSVDYPDGYRSPFDYWSMGGNYTGIYHHGWKATFDGQGHTISNLKLGQTPMFEEGDFEKYNMKDYKDLAGNQLSVSPHNIYTSLFGPIVAQNGSNSHANTNEQPGIIKDVNFVGCSLKEGLSKSSFLANKSFGIIDNVYLDVALSTSGMDDDGNSIFIGMDSDAIHNTHTPASARISNVTIVNRGTLGDYDYVIKRIGGNEAFIKGPVTVIGAPENKIFEGYSTLSDVRSATNGNLDARQIVRSRSQVSYSLDDKTIDIGVNGLEIDGEIQQIFYKGASLAFQVNGNVLTITDEQKQKGTVIYTPNKYFEYKQEYITSADFNASERVFTAKAQSATGAKEIIYVVTSGEVYEVPVKVVSDIIYTVEDFDGMQKFLENTQKAADARSGMKFAKIITGYYELGADLDFSVDYPNGYSSPFSYVHVGYQPTADTHGWQATFDGKGHTISNLKIVGSDRPEVTVPEWSASLFGMLGAQSKVCNVAFINGTLANNLFSSAFFANMVFGEVDNVLIDVTMTTDTNNDNSELGGNGAFAVQSNNRGFEYWGGETDISNVTVIVNGKGKYDYVMKGPMGENKNRPVQYGITGPFVVIGMPENRLHNQYASLEEIQQLNGQFKAYDTLISATNDQTLVKRYGSVQIVEFGDVATLYWGDSMLDTAKPIKEITSGKTFNNSDSFEMEKTLPQVPLTFEVVLEITTEQLAQKSSQYILSNWGDSATENNSFRLLINDAGKPTLYMHRNNGTSATDGDYYTSTNVNYDVRDKGKVHIVITTNGEGGAQNWQAYVNGTAVGMSGARQKVHTSMPVTNRKLTVGTVNDFYVNYQDSYFRGTMYSLALYKDHKDATEVEKDHTRGAVDVNDKNLMVAYDFSNSATNASYFKDFSKNSNDLMWQWSTEQVYNPDDYAFSFMVVGDTQLLTEYSVIDLGKGVIQSGNTYLDKVYNYIAANVSTKNVKHVFGLGDMTQRCAYNEWQLVQSNLNKLNDVVPYSVIPGNHDVTFAFANNAAKDANLAPYFKYHVAGYDEPQSLAFKNENKLDWKWGAGLNPYSYYNAFFGAGTPYAEQLVKDNNAVLGVNKTYADYSYMVPGSREKMPNTVHFIKGADNLKYMVLALENGPANSTVEWAKGLIEQYSDYNVIITTHAYMWESSDPNKKAPYVVEGDTNFADHGATKANTGMVPSFHGAETNDGLELWENLVSKYSNISMVLCGHTVASKVIYRQDNGDAGNVVTQMLIDPSYICTENYGQPLYKNDPNKNERNLLTGMVATYYVSADGKTIDVEWYSPLQNAYFRGDAQFRVNVHAI